MNRSMIVKMTYFKLRNSLAALLFVSFGVFAPAALASVSTPNSVVLRSEAVVINLMPENVSPELMAQASISASKAKAIARSRVPGSKYVDMSRRGNVYKVRVKKDGRVIDVLIDATTGRVLN